MSGSAAETQAPEQISGGWTPVVEETPAPPAPPVRRRGVPAGPVIIAAGEAGVMAGSSLYAAAGVPGLIAAGAVAGTAAAARTVRVAQRRAASRASTSGGGAGRGRSGSGPVPAALRRLAGAGRRRGAGGGPGTGKGAGTGTGTGRRRRGAGTGRRPGSGRAGGAAGRTAGGRRAGGGPLTRAARGTGGQAARAARRSGAAAVRAARLRGAGMVRAARIGRSAAGRLAAAVRQARSPWAAARAARRGRYRMVAGQRRRRGGGLGRLVRTGLGLLAALAAVGWWLGHRGWRLTRAGWRRLRGPRPGPDGRPGTDLIGPLAQLRTPPIGGPAAPVPPPAGGGAMDPQAILAGARAALAGVAFATFGRLPEMPEMPPIPGGPVASLMPGHDRGDAAMAARDRDGRSLAGGSGGVFLLPEQAETMMQTAAAYAPPSGPQIGRDMAQVPQAVEHIAAAIAGLSRLAADELPVHETIRELLDSAAAQIVAAAGTLANLGPLFELVHQTDLHRLRQPRPGEGLWDSHHAGDA